MTKKYSSKPRKPKPKLSTPAKKPARPSRGISAHTRGTRKPKLNVAEELLWQQINDAGLNDGNWRREFQFVAVRGWRADFAYLGPDNLKFIVEVDGGVFMGGRHTSPTGFVADMEKLNYAAIAGYKVLRFETSQVTKSMYAIDTIKLFMRTHRLTL